MFSGCTSFARSDGLARRRGRPEGADEGISLRAPPRIPQGIPHPSQAATYRNSPRSWVRPPPTGVSPLVSTFHNPRWTQPHRAVAPPMPVDHSESRLVTRATTFSGLSFSQWRSFTSSMLAAKFFEGILLFVVCFLVARGSGL